MHRSVIAVLAFVAFVLSACGGPAATSAAPNAPGDVSATSAPGVVDVAWQHDGRNVTSFVVVRRAIDASPGTSARSSGSPEAEVVAEVGADVRAYRDEAVALGRGYVYGVAARGPDGSSAETPQAGMPVSPACTAATDVVTIPDPHLAAGVRSHLGIAADAITCGDLEALGELVVERAGVTSLAGLQYATNLVTLRVNGNAIGHLWPLSGLTAIEHLQVASNAIADLTPIASLDGLRVLIASDNPITSIDVVAPFDALMYLGAAHTDITDIAALAGKEALLYVWINGATGIADFSPLAGATALEALLAGGTAFADADMAMLASMPALTRLQLWATSVSDLSALAGLDLRQELDIGGTAVVDLSPIHHMTALEQIRLYWLGLAEDDIAFLADFHALTLLNLHGNELTSLTPLVDHPALGDGVSVDVAQNRLDLANLEVQGDIAILEGRGVELTVDPQRNE